MVSYLDLMRARGRSAKKKTPTMKPQTWRGEQKKWAAQGLCVKCGCKPAQENSRLCPSCEDSQSMEDIRSDIELLRRRILNRQPPE